MGTLLADTLQTTSGGPLLGWTLLAETTASGEATIEITNLTSEYAMYKFIWSDLVPATDSADFWIRTDSDNGASFDVAGSDYAWVTHIKNAEGDHIAFGDNADSEILLYDLFGTNANETASFEITLFNPSGTEYTKVKWEGSLYHINKVLHHVDGAGVRLSAAAVDAIQFRFNTGNIESGVLRMYGVRK